MKVYKTKTKPFSGTRYGDISPAAFRLYNQIKKRSKRRPYVRSAYFKKEKIFLELFWKHLLDKKNFQDKARRLKYFPCAIELIQKSNFEPISKENPNKKSEILHRFYGLTVDNELFCIQIKEEKNKKNKQKFLMSTFPTEGL